MKNMDRRGSEIQTNDLPRDVESRPRFRATSVLPHWVAAFSLGILATVALFRGLESTEREAVAQTNGMAGARGVFAFSGQLDKNRNGLFMLDIEQGTIWAYELEEAGGGVRQMRLVAARSWLYDRYLRNFNCAQPTYQQVQDLVARERAQTVARRGGGLQDEEATGDGSEPNLRIPPENP
ncbi:MAG: hypothetical protein AB7N71_00070 [Phycisphaerae bacterium]